MTPTAALDAGGLIVGIDIGGTKTHLRAIPAAGGQRRDHLVASSDWRRRDWHEDASSLLQMVATLADGSPVDAIGIGAHGCDDAAECLALQAAFEARVKTPVCVVNDAELMPLALNMSGQIGVVAGTGSIAVCRPAGRSMMVAGGWGWIVGDEGSAPSLVRSAVTAIGRHFDAGGSRGEPLVEAMFEALQVPAIPRLGSALAQIGTASAVGQHARAVFDAADQGSDLACAVIEDGGRALASLVTMLQNRGANAEHVVAGGSVIAAQPRLWGAFVAGLKDACPDQLTPHLFTGVPVVGACQLALSLLADSPIKKEGQAPLYIES